MASTPRPRPRSDGSVAWQVYFHYRDTDRKRRQSSETFEEYAEAQWWAELIDEVGVEEALKVLEATRDTGCDGILLTTWLHRCVDRLVGVQEDGRRKYRRFIRNDIFGEGAPLEAVTQDTDAAWIVYLEQGRGNSPRRSPTSTVFSARPCALHHRQQRCPPILTRPSSSTGSSSA
ncbi:hypothetical protein [Nocardia asiatica]|uniref:hypothetical protein n=1 Tax=Nocardia asiatica TaxID=209252 RepID=UPI002455E92C|nr:hypothetical protein [Nocardia asiatica]